MFRIRHRDFRLIDRSIIFLAERVRLVHGNRLLVVNLGDVHWHHLVHSERLARLLENAERLHHLGLIDRLTLSRHICLLHLRGHESTLCWSILRHHPNYLLQLAVRHLDHINDLLQELGLLKLLQLHLGLLQLLHMGMLLLLHLNLSHLRHLIHRHLRHRSHLTHMRHLVHRHLRPWSHLSHHMRHLRYP